MIFWTQIRKVSAEQVYLVLLQNGDFVPENKIEQALEIVSNTCWEGDLENAKLQRRELSDIAGIETDLRPKTNTVPPPEKEVKNRFSAADENASYSSLVESTGFWKLNQILRLLRLFILSCVLWYVLDQWLLMQHCESIEMSSVSIDKS